MAQKTITLILLDGEESGIWQASLKFWSGKAYKIPRGRLKECGGLAELRTPGVYFLFGKDDESEKPFIYVGESDDVLKRISQAHSFEDDGSYWTEVVVFVTPDGTLDKGQIKYLENRFYTIAVEAKRYIVKNGNTPAVSQLAGNIRDSLDTEFIDPARLAVLALGHKAFVPVPSFENEKKETDEDLLFFTRRGGKGGKAFARRAEDGFWVLKGSYIYPHVAKYTSPGVKKARKKYKKIIDEKGILQEDINFGSPSGASTFVCGMNSSGLAEWKNKDGVSLKEIDSGAKAAASKADIQKSKPAKAKKAPHVAAAKEIVGETVYLTVKNTKASGYLKGTGIVVLKGSQMCPFTSKSCPDYTVKLRSRLSAEGKTVNEVFTEDVFFPSLSGAAGAIVGYSANGKVMWRYPDGKTVKDRGR